MTVKARKARVWGLHLTGEMTLLLVVGCASHWPELDLTKLPTSADHPGADAVVLLDEQHVRFRTVAGSSEPVADVTYHIRRRVLQTDGKQHATLSFGYQRAFNDLLKFDARLLRPDGTGEESGRDDAMDFMATPDFVLYDENRLVVLPFAGRTRVPVGSVVEGTWTIRYREPRLFLFEHLFGSALPVVESRLLVDVPRGWDISHLGSRLARVVPSEPTREETATGTRYVWTARDLVAIQPEPLAPRLADRGRRVAVQLTRWTVDGEVTEGFQSPEELSHWLCRLAEGTATATPETRALVQELTAELPAEPRIRAQRLYRWVQDHVRYCAQYIGYGGWQPHPAGKVLDVRYGDCKDKANLLRTLLEEANIESRLAVVYSHDGLPNPFRLPTLTGNFNHMILEVQLPDETMLVDPTSRSTPFGSFHPGIQGATYLSVVEGGTGLGQIPWADPAAHSRVETAELNLDSAGTATGKLTATATGHPAERLRDQILGKGDEGQPTTNWLGIHRLTTHNLTVEGWKAGEWTGKLEVEADVTLKHILGGAGGVRTLRASAFMDNWVPTLSSHKRSAPVVFPAVKHLSQRLRFTLPTGWSVAGIPELLRVETSFGSYGLAWSQEGDSVTVTREFTLSRTVVDLSEYAALEDLVARAKAIESEPVVFQTGGGGT